MIRSSMAKSPFSDVEISSLPFNKTVDTILEFLEKWLPVFRDDYSIGMPSHLEDKISENLAWFKNPKS
jgi:hypothetical protein